MRTAQKQQNSQSTQANFDNSCISTLKDGESFLENKIEPEKLNSRRGKSNSSTKFGGSAFSEQDETENI